MALRNSPRPARRRTTQSLQLEKLHLTNIRAIKEQTVSLKPLTVVVGGNSAGKSTLLKSILLVAQAQRDTGSIGEVRLNGRLVTLDKFDAVIRNGRADQAIGIGFEFALQESAANDQVGSRFPRAQRQDVATDETSASQEGIKFEMELGVHPATRGSASVQKVCYEGESERLELEPGPRVESPLDVREAVEISNFVGTSLLDNDPTSKKEICGVVLSGLIPVQSAVKVSLAQMLVEEILDKWQSRYVLGSQPKRQALNPQFVTFTLSSSREIDTVSSTEETLYLIARAVRFSRNPPEVLESLLTLYLHQVGPEIIAEKLVENEISVLRGQICADLEALWLAFKDEVHFETQSPAEETIVRDIRRKFQDFNQRHREVVARADYLLDDGFFRSGGPKRQQISSELRRYARAARFFRVLEGLEEFDFHKRWSQFDSLRLEERMVSATQLSEFFLNRVHYVGPLRRGPETVTGYRMRGTANQVGVDGENLAYLLTIDPTVSCPVWVPRSAYSTVENSEMRLQEALSYWMQQLQLAEQVTAREEPGIGDMIRLRMKGMDTDLSPNDVGVGVSQAMPVLAAVLMAKPGDLVILEQPELHLHPNAQLALADFFLAATRSGRRILIESHSEHFLSRIRLRSVETAGMDNGWISENVGFIFAEPELEGSDTGVTFRQVEVTTTGDIDDWPVGFFDQGPRESRRIFIRQQELDS